MLVTGIGMVSLTACNSGTIGSSAKYNVGDIVEFGSYQGVPIEWIVLDVEENSALVLSQQALDCMFYSGEKAGTTWADSSIRQWLNEEFYKCAFDDDERKQIKLQNVDNETYSYYDRDSIVVVNQYESVNEQETEDYIFCLSGAEVEQYYPIEQDEDSFVTIYTNEERVCYLSDFAKDKYQEKKCTPNDGCNWWLRSHSDT